MRGAQNKTQILDHIAAVRAGDLVWGRVNDLTPGDSEIVLTDSEAPLFIYNLAPGDQIFICSLVLALDTVSDNYGLEFGYTDTINGGGVFFPLTGHYHVYTGTTPTGRQSYDYPLHPPAVVRYAVGPHPGDGARCLTARLTANDASAVISAGWRGWRERV